MRRGYSNGGSMLAIGLFFLTLIVLGNFIWTIVIQVKKADPNAFDIIERSTYLIVDFGGNKTGMVAFSDNVDSNDPNLFMVFSLVHYTMADGSQRMDAFAIVTIPFNGTSTGVEEAYIDVEVPSTFMRALSFATATPWFTGAVGSVDPTMVVCQAISPLQQGDLSYPPNWTRFSVRPLAGAAHQSYASHSIRIEIYQL